MIQMQSGHVQLLVLRTSETLFYDLAFYFLWSILSLDHFYALLFYPDPLSIPFPAP